MRKIVFPPIEEANEDGLVAVGGDLEVDTILTAYKKGIFPWPLSSYPFNINLPHTWFSPDPRGVLEFKKFHLPRTFLKFLKRTNFKVSFNTSFEEVITQCSLMKRKNQPGTWITPEMIKAYSALFHQGKAYSVEVWNENVLVGGLYGVLIGEFISGESMFTLEDNAGKFGLYKLIERLKELGITWYDTQMVTEVVAQFGGKYISRKKFKEMIENLDWEKQIKL